MKINEIANMPYKLDISPTMSWGFDEKYYGSKNKDGVTAEFKTDAGEEYEIIAIKLKPTQDEKASAIEFKRRRAASGKPFIRLPSKSGGIWEISFTRTIKGPEGQQDDDDSVSGSGDAFRVFATVMEFIEWVVRNRQPKFISIKSKDVESRKSLYKKMAQRYAPKLGYEISRIVDAPEGQRINLKQTEVIDRKLDPSEY
jgi:hypothetical protein